MTTSGHISGAIPAGAQGLQRLSGPDGAAPSLRPQTHEPLGRPLSGSQAHPSHLQQRATQALASQGMAADQARVAVADAEEFSSLQGLGEHPSREFSIATGRAAPADLPFSADDAVSFRQMNYTAAIKVVDELLETHRASPHSRAAPQSLERLQAFREQLMALRDGEPQRANGLRVQAQKSAPGGQLDPVRELKLVNTILGGSAKGSFAAKVISSPWKKWIAPALTRWSVFRNASKGREFNPEVKGLHHRAALAAHMAGLLKNAGVEGTSTHKLLSRLQGQATQAYQNHQDAWKTIKGDIALDSGEAGGHQPSFHNELVPIRDASPQMALKYQARELRGVACTNTTESELAGNVWTTAFSGQGREGPVSFKAMRHAVLDPYGEKNAQARQAGAAAKARTLVQGAVDAFTDRLRPIGDPKDNRFELDIVSTSLVSPAAAEGQMLQHQLAAWKAVNGQPMKILRPDPKGGAQTIEVIPRVVAFNVPVNTYSLESGKVMKGALGGWSASDTANDTAIKTLVGDVTREDHGGMVYGALFKLRQQKTEAATEHIRLKVAGEKDDPKYRAALDREQALDRRIQLIEGLDRQIKEIMTATDDRSHRKAGHEPYKLVSRLNMLAHEIGAVPMFNCKSGKDRTGQADVEVKDLYAHYAMTGTLREVNHARNERENKNLATLFMQGGGLQIQKDNTGLPGSKVNTRAVLKPLRTALAEQFGMDADKIDGKAFKALTAGSSGYVGS